MVDNMKAFLEKVLRQKVSVEVEEDILGKLPIAYKGRHHIYSINTNGVEWVAIAPIVEIGLVMLRKDYAKIEKLSGRNCALVLEHATFYIKEKLMDEGIPFVLMGKQVYLPFIGMLLTEANDRELKPVHQISFLTQKLLLSAIYDKWVTITASEAARRLGISKVSAVRCFDEIEALSIDVLGMKGKSRVINVPEDIQLFWTKIKRSMRDPVIKKYVLRENIGLETKAGITALCEYSLLEDNAYPTYAITKKEIKDSEIRKERLACRNENIGCIVLELGYFINFDGKGTQDPLSVSLSLTEEEKEDERVSISMDEMLKEYVW